MYEITHGGKVLSSHASIAAVLFCLNDRRSQTPLPPDLDQVKVSFGPGPADVWSLRREHNRVAPVLDADGDPRDWLNLMLDEVMPFVKTELGAIKAPHEMTRAQWGAVTSIGSIGYGVMPCFTHETRGRVGDFPRVVAEEFRRRFGYGHNGPVYDNTGQSNSRHEVHVAYALARGDAVPQEVLQEYLTNESLTATLDMHWFGRVLRQPFLRGRFRTVEEMATALGLIGKEREISEENLPGLIQALSEIPVGANYIDVDNQLYAHGFLSLRPQYPLPEAESLGQPVNDFAERLHAELIQFRSRRDTKRLDKEALSGKLTQREIDERRRAIGSIGAREGYTWANRVAQAILDKNLPCMLDVLCDNNNEASQRATELEFGVRLRSKRAADRRRTVFGLAGFVSDEAYRQAELDLAAQVAQRKAQAEESRAPGRLAHLKEAAAMRKVRFEGEILTADLFIEKLLTLGFTEVVDYQRGATKTYYLRRGGDNNLYRVKASDGTLSYAKALLARAMPEAALATA
jgi:hypothetical protein